MRLRLEGSPEELEDPETLARLAKAVDAQVPALGAFLRKGDPEPPEPTEMHDPVLQAALARVRSRYRQTLDRMLAEIGKALDEG